VYVVFHLYSSPQIVLLSRTVQDLKDELQTEEDEYERSENEKDNVIADKDEEILDLQAKMDDMALEFGSMLHGTLEKMRERIELR
jgi:hypothetical protein